MAGTKHAVHRGRLPGEQIAINRSFAARFRLGEADCRDSENAIALNRDEDLGWSDRVATLGPCFMVRLNQSVGEFRSHPAAESSMQAVAIELRQPGVHRGEKPPLLR